MSDKTTYYQENKEKILNRGKKYYEDNKKASKEKTRNKYRELSEKEKNIKRKHGKIDIIICHKEINRD